MLTKVDWPLYIYNIGWVVKIIQSMDENEYKVFWHKPRFSFFKDALLFIWVTNEN